MAWLDSVFGGSTQQPKLSIAVDQPEYKAGDVLAGVVTLHVSERLENAGVLRLELIGKEAMSWKEVREKRSRGHSSSDAKGHCDSRGSDKFGTECEGDTERFDESDAEFDSAADEFDGDTGLRVGGAPPHPHRHLHQHHHRHRKAKCTVTREQAYMILETEIFLDVPAPPYDPGSYEFPFEYRLPHNRLIPTFQLSCGTIVPKENVNVAATYKLIATLPRRGLFVPDIRHTVRPVVREVASLPVPRSITLTKEEPVYFCMFFNIGSCDFSATLQEDAIRIGENAMIEITVENKSSRWVDSVRTRVIQNITLNHVHRRSGFSDGRRTSNCIASGSFTGVGPESRQRFTITQPVQHDGNWSSEMVPSMRTHFLTISYEIRVSLEQSWCWGTPTITFPLFVKPAGHSDSIIAE